MSSQKVLILGVTGMLGHALFNQLVNDEHFDVFGAARKSFDDFKDFFPAECCSKIMTPVYGEDFESLTLCLTGLKPDVVINCMGIIKQSPSVKNALRTITMNALLPHRLAVICKAIGAKLIHISTDCVFSGNTGNYLESDIPDPQDLYGRTKLLGEVIDEHCLTVRTSIIGHELKSSSGLLEWFLSQKDSIKGFTYAIYSGFPTVELARIIREFVLPNFATGNSVLRGLYQVSSEPISKYGLLRKIATIYQKPIEIEPDDTIHMNRSLNSTRFQKITGYSPPPWSELIEQMYQDFMMNPCYKNRHYSKE
jgi:dTDP-4-dehydrorhamnose reductase